MGNIDDAFQAAPRTEFLPEQERASADLDMPLPIGYGQTNSQPSTVKMMLEWLDVRSGQKVLDVGSGSGWTSALLANLVGKNGKVIAVEKIPELVEFARQNCRRLKIKNIDFHLAGSELGWPEMQPYDRILVSAASGEVPQKLSDQLAKNGIMVIPVQDTMYVLRKDAFGDIAQSTYPGFAFVPLV